MAKRQYTGDPMDMTQQYISERDLDDEAEDVEYATESDPAGEESTDIWPSAATPRDELNEKNQSVIEAAADPAREYESMYELSREVVPSMSKTYAGNVLYRHWPECDMVNKDDTEANKSTTSCERLGLSEPGAVDEARRRLVAGESSSTIAADMSVTKDVVLSAAKQQSAGYEKMDTDTPPVSYNDDSWEFVEPLASEPSHTDEASDSGGVEETESATEDTEDAEETESADGEIVSTDATDRDDGISGAITAAVAIVTWELARRVVALLRD